MKKHYVEPTLEVLAIRADEQFAANCGTTDILGNTPGTTDQCTIHRGDTVENPMNS